MSNGFLNDMLDNATGKSRKMRSSREFLGGKKLSVDDREKMKLHMKAERRKANIRLFITLAIGLGLSTIVYLILKTYGIF